MTSGAANKASGTPVRLRVAVITIRRASWSPLHVGPTDALTLRARSRRLSALPSKRRGDGR